MSDTKYTYAVARIRAMEVSLFSASTIEQLIACKTYESSLQFLQEKGWGTGEQNATLEAILEREEQKIWEVMKELSVDMAAFEILFYPNWFHNLKAAIKKVCTGDGDRSIYYEGCPVSPIEMETAIKEKNFGVLPPYMQEAAAEAFETLLHSRDGQLCDCIIDQATLKAIAEAGRLSKDDIIKQYAESTLVVANIKIAVRAQKTGKTREFMRRCMVPCSSLNIDSLMTAAIAGKEAVMDYLKESGYGEAAECLKESASAFERWCDNRLIQTIKPQRSNPFSIGPLVAYVIARENEIKTVRIILTCKQNKLGEDAIRERVREMYV